MSAKDLKVLTRRFLEEMNKGEAAAIAVAEKSLATDFVFHSGTGEDIHGLKDFKQHVSEIYRAFPDFHFTVDDIIVEGDKVVTRWTLVGTHKGEFMGIPPTNKKVKTWAITIDRVAGGKFVEEWERLDTVGFMQQLGVIPTSGK
jgi:steroid delta-isomerase-like uncharacterized protein